MATKVTVTTTQITQKAENQTAARTTGKGAPMHAPDIAFQIYTDEATGKSYVWTGTKWS